MSLMFDLSSVPSATPKYFEWQSLLIIVLVTLGLMLILNEVWKVQHDSLSTVSSPVPIPTPEHTKMLQPNGEPDIFMVDDQPPVQQKHFRRNVVSREQQKALDTKKQKTNMSVAKHTLKLEGNNTNFSSNFWTFSLETSSPYENISSPLLVIIPAPGKSRAASCVNQPIGSEYSAGLGDLPLISRGGKHINALFNHPKGYTFSVEASVGYVNETRDAVAFRIDLSRNPMPALYFTQGKFMVFKGKECAQGTAYCGFN